MATETAVRTKKEEKKNKKHTALKKKLTKDKIHVNSYQRGHAGPKFLAYQRRKAEIKKQRRRK